MSQLKSVLNWRIRYIDIVMLKMLIGFDCLSWKWEELVHFCIKAANGNIASNVTI